MRQTLDPEVVALVREIVDDPHSTLMRVPEAPLWRWLGQREPAVSAGEPFLTEAERHLLLAYREEAARLLWHACGLQVMARSKLILADEQTPPPSDETWRSRAEAFVGTRAPESLQPDQDILRGCLGDSVERPELSRIAVAALRIIPCDDIRNWLGLALFFEKQPMSALAVLQSTLAGRPRSGVRTYVLQSCGLVHYDRGDFSRALEHYEQAVLAAPDCPAAYLWSLTTSLQMGDEQAARRCGRRFSNHCSVNFVDRAVKCLKEARSMGTWTPSPVSRALSRKLLDSLSDASRRVVEIHV